MPTAFVHLGYGIDAATHRRRFLAGELPDQTPYGFHHAEALGYNVLFSVSRPLSRPVNLLRRALQRLLGFDLLHALHNLPRIRQADVLWTMEEIQYLALLTLPYVVPHFKLPPLIAQTVWLFDRWPNYFAPRRWMLRKLLRAFQAPAGQRPTNALTVHSRQYLDLIPRLVPGLTPHLLLFGISLDTFPLTRKPVALHTPIRILSVGGDPTRDWPALLAAFGNDPAFELQVVSPSLTDAQTAPYRNLKTPRNPTMAHFRALYAWADLVVIPMHANHYSGITVALEAVSQGVPVLASHTGGVPTYFAPGELLYLPREDPAAIRETVLIASQFQLQQSAANAQARFLREDYSTQGLAVRYVALSENLLAAHQQKG